MSSDEAAKAWKKETTMGRIDAIFEKIIGIPFAIVIPISMVLEIALALFIPSLNLIVGGVFVGILLLLVSITLPLVWYREVARIVSARSYIKKNGIVIEKPQKREDPSMYKAYVISKSTPMLVTHSIFSFLITSATLAGRYIMVGLPMAFAGIGLVFKSIPAIVASEKDLLLILFSIVLTILGMIILFCLAILILGAIASIPASILKFIENKIVK